MSVFGRLAGRYFGEISFSWVASQTGEGRGDSWSFRGGAFGEVFITLEIFGDGVFYEEL